MDKIIIELEKRLAIAEEKHPIFADCILQARCILFEEMGEVAKAVNDNSDNLIDELYDVMCVCLRVMKQFDGVDIDVVISELIEVSEEQNNYNKACNKFDFVDLLFRQISEDDDLYMWYKDIIDICNYWLQALTK